MQSGSDGGNRRKRDTQTALGEESPELSVWEGGILGQSCLVNRFDCFTVERR
jgi:hypothetical protein